MKPFRELSASDLASANIRAMMDEQGYVMIRGLLASSDLNPLLRDISEILHRAGWLDFDQDPIDRIANSARGARTGLPELDKRIND